jgi:hypothetical protein
MGSPVSSHAGETSVMEAYSRQMLTLYRKGRGERDFGSWPTANQRPFDRVPHGPFEAAIRDENVIRCRRARAFRHRQPRPGPGRTEGRCSQGLYQNAIASDPGRQDHRTFRKHGRAALSAHPGRTGIRTKEPKISQYKRYTAKTPVARAVDQLIEKYGGRLVLEAVDDHCFQHPGLGCFARGFGQAAEQLRSRISAISALEFGRTDGKSDLDTLGPASIVSEGLVKKAHDRLTDVYD